MDNTAGTFTATGHGQLDVSTDTQTSGTRLGEMTLAEVKKQLETNTARLEQLPGSSSHSEAYEKIKQLRKLKAHRMQNREHKTNEMVMQDLQQLQSEYQSDLQVATAREQAYQVFHTMTREDLQSIEEKKRQELEGLLDESNSLEQQEMKIHEDIVKLHKSLLQPESTSLQNYSSIEKQGIKELAGYDQLVKQSYKKDARRAEERGKLEQLALSQGRQIAQLDMQRKQLEEQQAGIREKLLPVQSSSLGSSQRLGSAFFDRLKDDKLRGEARLRQLRERVRDEEFREQRILEQALNDLHVDKFLRPLSSTKSETSHLDKVSRPSTREVVDHKVNEVPKNAAAAAEDDSLMAAVRALRRTYLKTGGKDTKILAQIQELEEQAYHQQYSTQQLHAKQMFPPVSMHQFAAHPISTGVSHQTWQLIKLVQEGNAKLMEEINQKRSQSARNLPLDHSLHQLELDNQKEVMKLRYEIEMARQKTELARIEFDREKLKPYEQRIHAPQHLHAALMDQLDPSHYDSHGGFSIFWDFVVGLNSAYSHVNLMTAIVSSSTNRSNHKALPPVQCRLPGHSTAVAGNVAVMAMKQSFPQFIASDDYTFIVELQGRVDHLSKSVATGECKAVGWTKIGLFDQESRILSGRWKLLIRISPAMPDMPLNELYQVPQVNQTELCLRIVNSRDVAIQSQVKMEPHLHYHMYKYPDSITGLTEDVNRPLSVGTGFRPSSVSVRTRQSNARTPTKIESAPSISSVDDNDVRTSSPGEVAETVGFQIQRVRDVWPGVAVVKLKGYQSNGKPMITSAGNLVWESSPVTSNFLDRVYEFGHQKVSFDQPFLHRGITVMVELWIGKRVRVLLQQDSGVVQKEEEEEEEHVDEERLDDYEKDLEEEFDSKDPEKAKRRGVKIVYEDQKLVGWSAFGLVNFAKEDYRDEEGAQEEEERDGNKLIICDGFHRLPLFKAEVMPKPEDLVLPIVGSTTDPYERIGNGVLSLRVYSDVLPRSTSPASDISEIRSISPPYEAWIPHQREDFSSDPFFHGDGFDFYIDGARFLPDIVTATRVSGRIFNHKYIKVGSKVDISTDIDLESIVYNPKYNYCLRVRDERLPPTSTILLKMYTRCRQTKELVVVGYSVLNVFVASGSDQQPATDSSTIPICLNEGEHQLRIRRCLPKLSRTMNVSFLDEVPVVPCASLLVRLVHDRDYRYRQHPESHTLPVPDYTDGVYYSMECEPSKGESRLFANMMTRLSLSVRDSMSLFGDGTEKHQRDDYGRRQWIAKRLWRLQEDNPSEIDLTYLSRYTPSCGIQVAVDSAQNLPWSKVTQCIYCFAPPASFYFGHTDDLVSYTKSLDWSSNQKCPEWRDGFKYFGRRRLHRYLAVVIHLIAMDTGRRGRLKVADEAWTALQVFSDGYVYTNRYQLPLYEGKPNKVVFDYLRHYPVSTALRDLIGQRKVRLLDGASVFARIADGRRSEEVFTSTAANLNYLPEEQRLKYTTVRGHQKKLCDLIPKGANENEYEEKLMKEFSELLADLLNRNKRK